MIARMDLDTKRPNKQTKRKLASGACILFFRRLITDVGLELQSFTGAFRGKGGRPGVLSAIASKSETFTASSFRPFAVSGGSSERTHNSLTQTSYWLMEIYYFRTF